MNRRFFATLVAVCSALSCWPLSARSAPPNPESLPGTQKLEMQGDLAERMVAGIDQFLLREIAESVARRPRHWKRDVASAEKYNQSVAPNRIRLAKIIGAADPRKKSRRWN